MENINYDFMLIQRIPSRNKIWRNEEADPRYENKQGSGDVVVEDELEAAPLQRHPEAAHGVVPDVSPLEHVLRGLQRRGQQQQTFSTPTYLLEFSKL